MLGRNNEKQTSILELRVSIQVDGSQAVRMRVVTT